MRNPPVGGGAGVVDVEVEVEVDVEVVLVLVVGWGPRLTMNCTVPPWANEVPALGIWLKTVFAAAGL